MARALRAVLRLFLRVFFRRIETSGSERVPRTGPLLLVLNHPNALIDPLFVLCLAPRPVSFLAKAPLFRTPVVSWFVRAFGSIPVERRIDPGADLTRNREMFARVRRHLAAGGALALFPEGSSHSDPRLKPLKSGAARIALGVRSTEPLRIQPVGLVYTAKETFRSSALVAFGEPFAVTPAPLDEHGEPPAAEVERLTTRITETLAVLTLQADEAEVLELVRRTEAILASAGADGEETAATPERMELRRRLLAGHAILTARAPERLERLRRRVFRYEARRIGAGLDPWDLPEGAYTIGGVISATARLLAGFALRLPLGLPGLALHYPAYRLVGFLTGKIGPREREALATVKALAAFLLFPLTWALILVLAWRWRGPLAGAAALVLAPLSGWMALRLTELWDEVVGAARALALYALGRRRFVHLQAERRAIREELGRIGAELERM
jgi:glycerol-3-phosphate O-acyltransferase/dihydroxyacetone phosphate acyltransferase